VAQLTGPPGRRPRRRPRGRPGWVALGLLAVPVVELYVIIQVGRLIGGWQTLLLVLALSALGGYLLRREGPAAWRRLQAAVRQGRTPSAELADAALVVVGGTLLLAPGFVTDLVGLVCVLPPTRPLARRLLLAALRRRVQVPPLLRPPGSPGASVPPGRGDVVQGQVVDDPRRDDRGEDKPDRPRPGG
jgi:UPF0716 protein FxsA